jgi:site-specific DNA recombinase
MPKFQKRYLALARVSSREQEREGFSLDVQEDGLRRYAEQHNGVIVKMFRIAETATKKEERKVFREFLAYARERAAELDGLLFYKVDRAARNLFDYVELERLEFDLGLEFVSVSQHTDNTPAGRMQRRMLASMASFYTEQQSLDVKEGLARRVKGGLFVGMAPYGYRNARVDGRGIIEIDAENASKVRRIFELYAYHGYTLDSLIEKLAEEGIAYTKTIYRFTRSKLHAILRDRAYIGEVRHRGQWYPGTHKPLIDRATWERVQVLLGNKVMRSHEMTYASELITCGYCGAAITGELKTKKTKTGEREYVYYRCSHYNSSHHPRVRLTEADLDKQVLSLFDKMRIEDEKVRDWIIRVLQAKTRNNQQEAVAQQEETQRQLTLLRNQQDRLLNLRLLEEIDAGTFARKHTELRDRIAKLTLQVEACDRGRAEHSDIALKAFELSQSLTEKWVTADYAAKRHILEIICLNFRLDDVTLSPTMRKPFDVLAEGLILKESRGERI